MTARRRGRHDLSPALARFNSPESSFREIDSGGVGSLALQISAISSPPPLATMLVKTGGQHGAGRHGFEGIEPLPDLSLLTLGCLTLGPLLGPASVTFLTVQFIELGV